jgi:hypothetical protein
MPGIRNDHRQRRLRSSIGTLLLALGYAALVLAAETTAAGACLLSWTEPVGRMAFTNYVLQSVILGFVFYSYGLGQACHRHRRLCRAGYHQPMVAATLPLRPAWVRSAPGFPCALFKERGRNEMQSSGKSCRENEQPRPRCRRIDYRAPFSVQEVVQVVILPWSHLMQALTHWSMTLGLNWL